MGCCVRCITMILNDDEPRTYEYTRPLLEEDKYFDQSKNAYIFEGGGKNE